MFLDEPPEAEIPLPDLRRLPANQVRELSPNFYDLIQDVRWKHDWYRQFLIESGASERDFVGSLANSESPVELADAISATIDLPALRRSSSSWAEFFRALAASFEDLGILVLRSGIVGNNPHRPIEFREFRGFAIADSIAPLIFINTRDAITARIFTLVHEAAHIWLGQSGISNPDPEQKTTDWEKTERLCNEAAAEVLYPKSAALDATISDSDPHQSLLVYAKHYRVSTAMVLVQLRKSGVIDSSRFDELMEDEQSRWTEPDEVSGSGGHPFRNYRSRYGRALVQAVAYSVKSGRTLYRDGAQILGVKPGTLDRIAEFEGIARDRR